VSERAIEYLDLDDLLSLATALLGDPVPVRDLGLLGAAAARRSASAFGEPAYPDLWSKAAALLHSIVSNHALVDGNKRLGWVGCAVFLDLNGVDPTVATNDVHAPRQRSRPLLGDQWTRIECDLDALDEPVGDFTPVRRPN
jgi:death-on-curing protein